MNPSPGSFEDFEYFVKWVAECSLAADRLKERHPEVWAEIQHQWAKKVSATVNKTIHKYLDTWKQNGTWKPYPYCDDSSDSDEE